MPRPELTELLARALLLLGSERAWVVHGADGIDEMSTTGYTKVSECRRPVVRTFYLHPTECRPAQGLAGRPEGRRRRRQRAPSSAPCSAGDPGPGRDVVVLNAGAALFVAGRATSLKQGIALAAAAIDDGRAARTLEALVAVTTEAAA